MWNLPEPVSWKITFSLSPSPSIAYGSIEWDPMSPSISMIGFWLLSGIDPCMQPQPLWVHSYESSIEKNINSLIYLRTLWDRIMTCLVRSVHWYNRGMNFMELTNNSLNLNPSLQEGTQKLCLLPLSGTKCLTKS